ncbi:MAG: tetraacyldisaccharide 4'-kinase [Candidatus Krumholzibacteriota bacterium]|nr:tetraacyldisaccharide 4'-kinase [Candidatus Krumholzibacteriota bacterium]
MKIIERYPSGLRIFMGKGGWALLNPVRYLLAVSFRAYLLFHADDRKRKAAGKAEGKGGHTPVTISIGNIEVGGSGKTPAAISIAGNIAEVGGRPVIVTRGYKGSAERAGKSVVISGPGDSFESEGDDYITEDLFIERLERGGSLQDRVKALGDEALLLAVRGFPVVVDPDRRRGVRVASGLFDPTHILLDDAFQNRKIERDIDILLLDHEKPFGKGWIVPAGTLREPPSAAARADAVIFTRASSREIPKKAVRHLKGKKLYFARHNPSGLRDRSGELRPFSVCDGKELIIFSGIARPDSFESTLLEIGLHPAVSIRFPDHHFYTEEDVAGIISAGTGSSIFITTEKDRAKALDFFTEDIDFYSLEIEMEIRPACGGENDERSSFESGSVDIDSILITSGKRSFR